jgi:hypothetical protein
LQKSHISSLTRIPIFASILNYWHFFDFQYSPEFRGFGKNWISMAGNFRIDDVFQRLGVIINIHSHPIWVAVDEKVASINYLWCIFTNRE